MQKITILEGNAAGHLNLYDIVFHLSQVDQVSTFANS